MSMRQRFARDTVATGLVHIMVSLRGLLIIPIVTKTVGTTVLGGYSLLVSAVTLLAGVSSLGTYVRYRRFFPSEPDTRRRAEIFYPQLGFHLAFSLLLAVALVLAFGPSLSSSIQFESSPWWILPYVIVYALFLQVPNYFRYTKRIFAYNVATVLVPYLFIFAVLIGLAFGLRITVDRLILLEGLAMAIVIVPFGHRILAELGYHFYHYRWPQFRVDVTIGVPLVMAFVIDFALAASDRFFIGSFVSVAAVGIYVPAYALASLIATIAKVAGVVLPPMLAELVDKGEEREAAFLIDATLKVFLVVAVPFVVALCVMGSDVLTLLATADVAKGSQYVAPIVALGSVFYGLTLILDNILFVRLRTAALFRASSLAAVLNMAMNIVLLPIVQDIRVAAVSTLVGYVVMYFYVARSAAQDWTFSIDVRALIKIFVASLVMAGVLLAVKSNTTGESDWLAVMLEVGLGIGVYAGCAVAIGVFSASDRQLLREVMGRAR